MAHLPRHPDTDDESTPGARRQSPGGTPWGTYLLATILVVAVLGMVILHLTGVVGPGAHSR